MKIINLITPMKTATGLVVLAILFQSCQATVEEKIELGESGDTHQYKQLRLFPIRANDAFLKRREKKASYLTLNEAVSAKKVSITEHVTESLPSNRASTANILERDPMEQDVYGSTADVNKLYIENTSSDTVLILGGEVVEGGNQDRTIAQDVLLPPHSGKIDLSVFCVEHGRWSGDTDTFAVAKSSLAPGKVRKAAMKMADQQKVWEEVASELAENKATSHTDAVKALKQQAEYVATQREFEQALADAFADDETVIGVIATAGTEIIGCELFASHELFITYYPNLLQSWVSEAIDFSESEIDNRKVSQYFEFVVKKKLNEDGFVGRTGNRTPHVSVFN
jgi:hypothetical protein